MPYDCFFKWPNATKDVAVPLVHDETAVEVMLSSVLAIDVGRRRAITETRIGSNFLPANIADELADLTYVGNTYDVVSKVR